MRVAGALKWLICDFCLRLSKLCIRSCPQRKGTQLTIQLTKEFKSLALVTVAPTVLILILSSCASGTGTTSVRARDTDSATPSAGSTPSYPESMDGSTVDGAVTGDDAQSAAEDAGINLSTEAEELLVYQGIGIPDSFGEWTLSWKGEPLYQADYGTTNDADYTRPAGDYELHAHFISRLDGAGLGSYASDENSYNAGQGWRCGWVATPDDVRCGLVLGASSTVEITGSGTGVDGPDDIPGDELAGAALELSAAIKAATE